MNQDAIAAATSQAMDVDAGGAGKLKEVLADIRATKLEIANLKKEVMKSNGTPDTAHPAYQLYVFLNGQLDKYLEKENRLTGAAAGASAQGAAPLLLGPDNAPVSILRYLYELGTRGLSLQDPIFGEEENGRGVYVRECYPDMVQALLKTFAKRVLVSGTLGTGKSVFGLYFLDYLIRHMATLQPRPECIIYYNVQFEYEVLFREGKCYAALAKDRAFVTHYGRSYYLFDSAYGLEPTQLARLKTFVFASPREGNRNEFEKNDVDKIFMPLWELDEVLACARQCFSLTDPDSGSGVAVASAGPPAVREFTVAELTQAYAKHGGVPRTLLKKRDADLNLERTLNAIRDVEILFDHMLGAVKISDDPQASQRILHILVDRQTFQQQRVCLASRYIAEVLGTKYVLQTISKARSFMFGASGSSEAAALCGDLFEGYVHHLMQPGLRLEGRRLVTRKELTAHRQSTGDPKSHPHPVQLIDVFDLARQLAPLSQGAAAANKKRKLVTLVPPGVDVPSVAGMPVQPFVPYQVFTELEQLLHMAGQYARPAWRNLAAVDALLVPLLWFQMTVSLHHPISQAGLNELFRLLQPAEPVRFFFVVPDAIFDDFCLQSYYAPKEQVASGAAAQDEDKEEENAPGPVKNSRTSQKLALEDEKAGRLEQWVLRVPLTLPHRPLAAVSSAPAGVQPVAMDVDVPLAGTQSQATKRKNGPSSAAAGHGPGRPVEAKAGKPPSSGAGDSSRRIAPPRAAGSPASKGV